MLNFGMYGTTMSPINVAAIALSTPGEGPRTLQKEWSDYREVAPAGDYFVLLSKTIS